MGGSAPRGGSFTAGTSPIGGRAGGMAGASPSGGSVAIAGGAARGGTTATGGRGTGGVSGPCAGILCSGHGTCSNGVCSCSTGYAGTSCSQCASGYTGYPTCTLSTLTNMTWTFRDTCNDGYGPNVGLYDETASLSWGPYFLQSYNVDLSQAIQCTSGHQICWGAWMGSTYWGCGQDCAYSCADCCYACGSSVATRSLGC